MPTAEVPPSDLSGVLTWIELPPESSKLSSGAVVRMFLCSFVACGLTAWGVHALAMVPSDRLYVLILPALFPGILILARLSDADSHRHPTTTTLDEDGITLRRTPSRWAVADAVNQRLLWKEVKSWRVLTIQTDGQTRVIVSLFAARM